MRPDEFPTTIPQMNRRVYAKDAEEAIRILGLVQARVIEHGKLHTHIEWVKEAVWAAAYPGSPDDTLLNGLDTEAEQAG